MPHLPTGTVTFLFTDIEGSTRLWEQRKAEMKDDLERHDEILRSIIEQHSGYVFKTVGDAFCGAFSTALDGLGAALDAQSALLSESWAVPGGIRVRMGLHTGSAEERNGDYFGPTLNRVARLLSIGYGGQTLVSLVTAELLRDVLPGECRAAGSWCAPTEGPPEAGEHLPGVSPRGSLGFSAAQVTGQPPEQSSSPADTVHRAGTGA